MNLPVILMLAGVYNRFGTLQVNSQHLLTHSELVDTFCLWDP